MHNPVMDMRQVLRDLPSDAKKALRRCRSKADFKALLEKHVIALPESGATKDSSEWRKNAVRAFFHEKPAPKPAAVEAPKAPPVSLRDQPRPKPAAPVNAPKVAVPDGKRPGTAWTPPPAEQGKPKVTGTAWKPTSIKGGSVFKPKIEEPPEIEPEDLLEPEEE
ncbi:MAG: hypothetical protein PHC52_00530 [Syntrophales bacterium]|nr:hypothetical protein [Syntrophales bacterium]